MTSVASEAIGTNVSNHRRRRVVVNSSSRIRTSTASANINKVERIHMVINNRQTNHSNRSSNRNTMDAKRHTEMLKATSIPFTIAATLTTNKNSRDKLRSFSRISAAVAQINATLVALILFLSFRKTWRRCMRGSGRERSNEMSSIKTIGTLISSNKRHTMTSKSNAVVNVKAKKIPSIRLLKIGMLSSVTTLSVQLTCSIDG